MQAALYSPGLFYNRAKHFEEVHGDGRGGGDRAELHDSALDDLLEAADSWVRLSNLDLGSFYQVSNFAHVKASASAGNNRRDVGQSLAFTLEYEGNWIDL